MKIKVLLFLLIGNFLFAQKEINHVVYFDTDKYIVPEIEQDRLLLFIQKLDSVIVEKISIYGFCDDVGSEAYNLELSQKRANAIKLLLSNNNIGDSLISNVDGKGEVLLKIINTKDANIIRSLNRRVEIVVSHKPIDSKKDKEKKEAQKILSSELKVGDKVLLENILFKTGYRDIIPESKKTLEKIAEILVKRKNIYFTIRGHVCCTKNSRDAVEMKTKKRNLSLVRAKYIYDYLAKKGVSKKRMKYVGMRRKFPLGGDPKFDRRVEIVITYIAVRN
ncbi:MAG: OmpA family protein [Flavobacteriaceae bacterium]|nr:OmpA family protein [Flavobacteriaceae bacterium]